MDQRKGFNAQMLNRDTFTIPKLAYEFYFKLFGYAKQSKWSFWFAMM